MSVTELKIRTADGEAAAWGYRPEGDGSFPAVVFLIDAFGVRPAMHEMAERLSKQGYYVLLPNLLYRAGAFAPFDPKSVWTDAKERDRLMAIIKQLDTASAMRDFAAYFEVLSAQTGVLADKVGLTGYCMGGRLAFTAAEAMPDRVGAAAAFHAGGLVTEEADSPHLNASKIKAQLYFGVADEDRSCTPEQQGTLVSALAKAKLRFQLELYPGAQHGFAMPDTPAYNREAYDRHWTRMLALFGEALPRSR